MLLSVVAKTIAPLSASHNVELRKSTNSFPREGGCRVSVINRCPDPWLISSLLQKAIRRGDEDTSCRAAIRFLELRANSLWRRLLVIAYEDVGLGAVDTLCRVCAACDSAFRKAHGPDQELASDLARALARSPKSRAAENLWTIACHSAGIAPIRESILRAGPDAQRAALQDSKVPLLTRAAHVAVRPSVALTNPGEWLGAILDRDTISAAILSSTVSAARITREPFVLMLPLIWMAANVTTLGVVSERPPQVRRLRDFPLYALDKHTRLGRTAIRRFAAENGHARAALAAVPKQSRLPAAYMAAFYADAAAVDRWLALPNAGEFEQQARTADLLRSGVPLPDHPSLQSAFEQNLHHLNELRAEVYVRAHGRTVEEGE